MKKRFFADKKTLPIITAFIIIAVSASALTIGDILQHKTDLFKSASGGDISVTLNNLCDPPVNWEEGQTAVNKISVTNLSASDGNAYVRLQLKEYMETYILGGFIVGGDNKPILFATYTDGARIGEYMLASEIPDGYDYGTYTVNGTAYATTNIAETKNGVYGKPMRSAASTEVWGNVPKSQLIHELQTTDECGYLPYIWGTDGITNANAGAIRNYIELLLGDTMTMAEWEAPSGNDRALGEFWILDADGWAYWGKPIEPGETTGYLLEAVKLISNPGTELEYYIHIDMQAADISNLWASAPDGLKNKFTGDASSGGETSAGVSEASGGGEESNADSAVSEEASSPESSLNLNVGDIFSMDAVNWIVIAKDGKNNLLVTTQNCIGTTVYGDDENKYELSYLKQKIDEFYDNLYEIKQYTQPTVLVTELASSSIPSDTATGGISYVGDSGIKMAFALSLSEVNSYFDGDGARKPNISASYWLRTPYQPGMYNTIYTVTNAGKCEPASVAETHGIRPAIWIK